MTLPPWKSSDPKDQQALTRFIISELDRADEKAIAEASGNTANVTLLRLFAELQSKAARLGIKLSWPKRASKPGPKPKDEPEPFDWAVLDVPRIRALFKRHWNKRNRTMRPLAEDIAAERWELSAEERAALIDKFSRKG